MYVIFSILMGCSIKPSHYENQDQRAVREYAGTTKNVNQTESQKDSQKILESPAPSAKEKVNPTPSVQKKVILDVPLISQNPELKYGCEVTS